MPQDIQVVRHGEVSLTQGRRSRTLIIDSRARHYGELRFSLTPCLPFRTEKSRVLFPGDNGNVSQAWHSRPSTRHSCAFERVQHVLFFVSFSRKVNAYFSNGWDESDDESAAIYDSAVVVSRWKLLRVQRNSSVPCWTAGERYRRFTTHIASRYNI